MEQHIKKFEEVIFNQHDVVCNQKYGDNLPYSFHLKAVLAQYHRFCNLLNEEEREIAWYACIAHDVLEDARYTYRDLASLCNWYVLNPTSTKIADTVYAVTDFKGKNRAERKPEAFYEGLNENRIALFVKLCDMMANKYYSCLTNSSMQSIYDADTKKLKEKCWLEEFKIMFDTLEDIY